MHLILFSSSYEILWKIRIVRPASWCPACSVRKTSRMQESTWKRASQKAIEHRYYWEKPDSIFRKSWSRHRQSIQRNAAALIQTKRSHCSRKRKWLICKRYLIVLPLYVVRNFERMKFHHLQEIILGCNKTSHRLFLIPSLFIFTRIFAPLILLIEVYLHVWAHRKNSRNTNANIYYRSPLHIITAQFCANCRNHSEMEQVSRLQDKRLQSWRQHIRDMARSMY